MYKVAKNPNDNKYYVIGYCGDRFWMPVSSPFNTYKEASKRLIHLQQADKDAINCVKQL